MEAGLRGYKLCKSCGAPMLKKGQRRKGEHDYRHCYGCPLDRTKWGREWAKKYREMMGWKE